MLECQSQTFHFIYHLATYQLPTGPAILTSEVRLPVAQVGDLQYACVYASDFEQPQNAVEAFRVPFLMQSYGRKRYRGDGWAEGALKRILGEKRVNEGNEGRWFRNFLRLLGNPSGSAEETKKLRYEDNVFFSFGGGDEGGGRNTDKTNAHRLHPLQRAFLGPQHGLDATELCEAGGAAMLAGNRGSPRFAQLADRYRSGKDSESRVLQNEQLQPQSVAKARFLAKDPRFLGKRSAPLMISAHRAWLHHLFHHLDDHHEYEASVLGKWRMVVVATRRHHAIAGGASHAASGCSAHDINDETTSQEDNYERRARSPQERRLRVHSHMQSEKVCPCPPDSEVRQLNTPGNELLTFRVWGPRHLVGNMPMFAH